MPWFAESWHVPLYVSGSGLITGLVTHGCRDFDLTFDLRIGELRLAEPKTINRYKAAIVARIFITGSTEGPVLAAAQALPAGGHDVVLHARPTDRAEQLGDLRDRVRVSRPSPAGTIAAASA